MKGFVRNLLLFSILIAILDYSWNRFVPQRPVPHALLILAFFFTATLVFHSMSVTNAAGKPQAFIRFYMAGTLIRLVLYVLIIAAYRFYDKATGVAFAIGFLVHYMLFTVFEVAALLSQLKEEKKQE